MQTQFITMLEKQIVQLQENPDFNYGKGNGVFKHVSREDLVAIYKWIVENKTILDTLTPDKPIRIAANKPEAPLTDFPCPVNIHFTQGTQGLQMHIDPNSQLARAEDATMGTKDDSTKIDPETKKPIPQKQVGHGGYKTLRTTWSLNVDGTLEPSVAYVTAGTKAVSALQRAATVYNEFKDTHPFLFPLTLGATYAGHGKHQGLTKAIAFAPLADGDLLHINDRMGLWKPDLADLFWMLYSVTYSIHFFHPKHWVGDVKFENFVFCRAPDGSIRPFLIDLDSIQEAKDTQGPNSIGTPSRYAFDRPVFNPLIEVFNKVLKDVEALTKDRYDSFSLTEAEEKRYQSLKDIGKTAYIRKHCAEARTKYSKECQYVIDILLAQESPVPLQQQTNCIAEDTYALGISLFAFIHKFKDAFDTAGPLLGKLASTIYYAVMNKPRDKRLTTEKLLGFIETTIKQIFSGHAGDLSTRERAAFQKKFSKQLRHFNLSIKGLTLAPSSPSTLLAEQSFLATPRQPPETKNTPTVTPEMPKSRAPS